jgi:hypothetical protein
MVGVVASLVITGAIAWASRGEGAARLWITAAAVTVALIAIGLVDLMREQPRETHIATLLVGIPTPILGAVGLQYAMRRARPWIRWGVVFLVVFVLLFVGVLIGAAILPPVLSG